VIINKCKSLLCHFQICKISYVWGQVNRVTHKSFQVARLYASYKIFEFCPPCIVTIVMNEIN
jgi:hypothetical protein